MSSSSCSLPTSSRFSATCFFCSKKRSCSCLVGPLLPLGPINKAHKTTAFPSQPASRRALMSRSSALSSTQTDPMAATTTSRSSSNHLIVIIPAPGIGHLVSTVELANTLLLRHGGFSIAILVIKAFADDDKFAQKLAGLNPSITLVHIPKIDPTFLFSGGARKELEAIISLYIEAHKAHVTRAVETLTKSIQFDSVQFVIDMFCTPMIDVADAFNAKSYIYVPSNAAFLGLLQFMLTRPYFESISASNSIIPGYSHPVPDSVLPSFVFSEDSYASMSDFYRRFYETKGIIVNTTSELESSALRSVSVDSKMAPVYAVGPLLDLAEAGRVSEKSRVERDRIVKWLDEQDNESVVFLCFGSMGSFGLDQVKEIAFALEKSGVKFLWALRKPPAAGEIGRPSDFADPQEILPEGFMSRVGQRGLVCGWAPQIEILAHNAIGGFISHCGWNSILESLWFGVPIATWPMYAEQQVNAFYMVKDLNLAVDLSINYRLGQADVVPATLIEGALTLLMDPNGEKRKRVKEMSERIRKGVIEGGSASDAIERLVEDMLGN